jgi:murein DD-endopeptidase MepM/ murein hydrolase activator NlpD
MGQPQKEVTLLDQPGFPFMFELNPGESQVVTRSYQGKTIRKKIKLIAVHAFSEPNYWFPDTMEQMDYYQFIVDLEIAGKPVSLYHRPYQMPVAFEGLRIYIENIKQFNESAEYGKSSEMVKEVRISVCMENEPWGPEYIDFPINNYVWRSAVYNNTWSSLVPFNKLYYHRGEDYGAIPDHLEVVSPVDGIIRSTPIPDGAKGSNTVSIVASDGLRWDLAHMNIESIRPEYTVGTEVSAGTVLGKTGMTWAGKKSQEMDPHLHVGLSMNRTSLASFPYLMEAYMRKYPDPVFAIAGGYRFAIVGQPVELDASRSFSRHHLPVKYRWRLSNGEVSELEKVIIKYEQPGIYTEELQVESNEGKKDRDFLYVKVYDTAEKRDFAFGWAYYYPLRDIQPGDEVLFWNRLANTMDEVKINYGDNPEWSTISKEATHRYNKPGKYVVTLKSTGQRNEPVTLKMEVTVK